MDTCASVVFQIDSHSALLSRSRQLFPFEFKRMCQRTDSEVQGKVKDDCFFWLVVVESFDITVICCFQKRVSTGLRVLNASSVSFNCDSHTSVEKHHQVQKAIVASDNLQYENVDCLIDCAA